MRLIPKPGLLLPHRTLKLFAFECHPVDSPALLAELGTPNHAERSGTYVNVDGVRGPISPAKPAPLGVRPLVRHLEDLVRLSPQVGAR